MSKQQSEQERDLEHLAQNIVFQLADVYVPAGIEGVKLRQSTNDKHIDWAKDLINKYVEAQLAERELGIRLDESLYWRDNVVPAVRGTQFEYNITKRLKELSTIPQEGEAK